MAAIPPDDDPDRVRVEFSLSQLSVDRGDAEGKLRWNNGWKNCASPRSMRF